MSLIWMLLILFLLGLLSLIGLLLLKGETVVFSKKVKWFCFFNFLGFALLGLMGLLLRPPALWKVFWLFLVLMLANFLLGWWYTAKKKNLHPWIDREARPFRLELFFLAFLLCWNALAFTLVFGLVEYPGWSLDLRYADNLTTVLLVFPIPLVLKKSYDLWLQIPQKKVTTWILPIDEAVPLIEAGRSIILHFHIPTTFRSKETIKFNTRAPLEKDLGKIFHFLLYRHNVERRSYNKIQIAENNKKEKLYGWKFFKKEKRWSGWWERKKYVDPEENLRRLGLKTGDVIHVRRVEVW